MTLLIIELDHPHSNVSLRDVHDNEIVSLHLAEGLAIHNADAWAAVRAKGPGIAQMLDALRAELIGAPPPHDHRPWSGRVGVGLRDEVEALQRRMHALSNAVQPLMDTPDRLDRLVGHVRAMPMVTCQRFPEMRKAFDDDMRAPASPAKSPFEEGREGGS